MKYTNVSYLRELLQEPYTTNTVVDAQRDIILEQDLVLSETIIDRHLNREINMIDSMYPITSEIVNGDVAIYSVKHPYIEVIGDSNLNQAIVGLYNNTEPTEGALTIKLSSTCITDTLDFSVLSMYLHKEFAYDITKTYYTSFQLEMPGADTPTFYVDFIFYDKNDNEIATYTTTTNFEQFVIVKNNVPVENAVYFKMAYRFQHKGLLAQFARLTELRVFENSDFKQMPAPVLRSIYKLAIFYDKNEIEVNRQKDGYLESHFEKYEIPNFIKLSLADFVNYKYYSYGGATD